MYVKVRVTAGMRKEKFEKISDTEFSIHVQEPAKANQANKRVQSLLATQFDLPVRQIRLVTGHHSPSKIFAVNLKT